MSLRTAAKRILNAVALVVTAPVALSCAVADVLGIGHAGYTFWAQTLSLLPGVPGRFLRRGFYRWMLRHCAEDVTIEFGAVLSRRGAELGSGVYIGAYALIGWVRIGDRTLVGSRVSVLSGTRQHQLSPDGRWLGTDPANLQRISLGADTWVGEGAIIMADVGTRCMVSAGGVVSTAVPDGVMVAGNPARFVRRVDPAPLDHEPATS